MNKHCHHTSGAGGGAVYGLGMIGAAIYFFPQATSLWTGFLALLKAMVWPAYVVYELLKYFQV